MTQHRLSLRLIGLSDYRVIRDGRAIGRIRLADERSESVTWEWSVNPPLPIPSWAKGTAASLQDAKVAFQEAWQRFYVTLTAADIERWHRDQDRAHERSEWSGWT
jgi:hypothetical protein